MVNPLRLRIYGTHKYIKKNSLCCANTKKVLRPSGKITEIEELVFASYLIVVLIKYLCINQYQSLAVSKNFVFIWTKY